MTTVSTPSSRRCRPAPRRSPPAHVGLHAAHQHHVAVWSPGGRHATGSSATPPAGDPVDQRDHRAGSPGSRSSRRGPSRPRGGLPDRVEVLHRAVAASPASFQPSNAAISTGRRSGGSLRGGWAGVSRGGPLPRRGADGLTSSAARMRPATSAGHCSGTSWTASCQVQGGGARARSAGRGSNPAPIRRAASERHQPGRAGDPGEQRPELASRSSTIAMCASKGSRARASPSSPTAKSESAAATSGDHHEAPAAEQQVAARPAAGDARGVRQRPRIRRAGDARYRDGPEGAAVDRHDGQHAPAGRRPPQRRQAPQDGPRRPPAGPTASRAVRSPRPPLGRRTDLGAVALASALIEGDQRAGQTGYHEVPEAPGGRQPVQEQDRRCRPAPAGRLQASTPELG